MRIVGWALGFVAALAAAGLMLFVPNDALAQSKAIDAGSAETVTATLNAHLDKNVRHRVGKPDRDRADEWTATCASDDPAVDIEQTPSFDIPGKGEILGEWDGETVTCSVWTDGTVIAIKGPDGTLLKSETVGWRGALSRWTSGLFALGIALLIGGTTLRMGFWTAFAGGVLVGGVLFVVLHVTWPWVAVAVDVALVLAIIWYVVKRRRRSGVGDASVAGA